MQILICYHFYNYVHQDLYGGHFTDLKLKSNAIKRDKCVIINMVNFSVRRNEFVSFNWELVFYLIAFKKEKKDRNVIMTFKKIINKKKMQLLANFTNTHNTTLHKFWYQQI